MANQVLSDGINYDATNFIFTSDNAYPGSTQEASTTGAGTDRIESSQAALLGSGQPGGDFSLVLGEGTGGSNVNFVRDLGSGLFTSVSVEPATTIGGTSIIQASGPLQINGAIVPDFNLISLPIANKAAGGAIGTAAATVDIYSSFIVHQTTAGQTLSLPTPTTTTTGKIAFVVNDGTASFTMHTVVVSAGYVTFFIWENAGGSGSPAWRPMNDSMTTTGYINGGNAFGVPGTLGLTDNNQLSLIANNATVARLTASTSAVNFVDLLGTVTGSYPQITANGSDTNIDLYFAPKNSGALRFAPGVNSTLSAFFQNAGNSQTLLAFNTLHATMTYDSAQLYSAFPVFNTTIAGPIGGFAAAVTVDCHGSFLCTQTTGGNLALTLATPTDTTAGRRAVVTSNTTSTQNFTMYGVSMTPGDTVFLRWNGSTWNPYASTSSSLNAYLKGGNAFGANATIGLTDNFDLSFVTNNTAWIQLSRSGGFIPVTDSTSGIGNNTTRFASMSSIQYNVYAAASDANPSAQLISNALKLGVGGATALDVIFKSLGSNKPAILNGSSAAIPTMTDAATVQLLAYDTATGQVGPTTTAGKLQVTAVKTANYTTTFGELVRCDPSGGAFTVTLPAAAAVSVGQTIVVKNTTSSTTAITIARAGSDTIDTATSASITVAYGSVTIACTSATTWNLI